MKEIVIGTGNMAKEMQIRSALSSTDVTLLGLREFDTSGVEVEEDGKTAQENARKKALTYAKLIKKPVLAMDNALYLEGLEDSKQPGINVRRILAFCGLCCHS